MELELDGAKLAINEASWEDAKRLQDAVLKISVEQGFKMSDLQEDKSADKIFTLAASAYTDKDVYAALWPCLARCTINGEKITKATFEDAKNRKYFPIAAAKCVEVNFGGFIEGLALLF